MGRSSFQCTESRARKSHWVDRCFSRLFQFVCTEFLCLCLVGCQSTAADKSLYWAASEPQLQAGIGLTQAGRQQGIEIGRAHV